MVPSDTGEIRATRETDVRITLNVREKTHARATYLFLGLAMLLASSSAAGEARPTTTSFDETLRLLGIEFHVSCPNEGSESTLTIVPSGLEIDNSTITRTVQGTVVGAEIADLNGDQSPEIYVYVQSVGSGSYASLVAYSANRRKSLSEIYLPPISQNPKASKGYMGHDEFAIVGSSLVRRFPVYREGDTNASPTGGTRQIEYKLAQGEAGWILNVDNIAEF
jgi:hypothetical protein